MKHFNLFVLPSKAEGISNTILEAMACDLPVVATNVGGNPDLVDDNVTGKIVPSEDPLSLSNAMLNYLQEKALAKQHGIAGGQRVKTNFSIEAMLQNYDDLYQNRQKNA
jgi:glycosyltransferase involved in cell wall biosynthesis